MNPQNVAEFLRRFIGEKIGLGAIRIKKWSGRHSPWLQDRIDGDWPRFNLVPPALLLARTGIVIQQVSLFARYFQKSPELLGLNRTITRSLLSVWLLRFIKQNP
jgi:hypothetical protein